MDCKPCIPENTREKVAILPLSIPLSLSLQFAVSSRLSRLPAPKKREKAKEEAVLIFALRSLPSSPYLPTEQSLHLPFRPPTKQAAPGRESTIFWPRSCLACPDPFLAPPQTFGGADLLSMTKGGGEEREKGPDTRPTSFAPSDLLLLLLRIGSWPGQAEKPPRCNNHTVAHRMPMHAQVGKNTWAALVGYPPLASLPSVFDRDPRPYHHRHRFGSSTSNLVLRALRARCIRST